MKKILLLWVGFVAAQYAGSTGGDLTAHTATPPTSAAAAHLAAPTTAADLDVPGDSLIEPCTYTENFENHDLGAWASYPFWQDLAYDQNFRIDQIVPGDANISLVEKVTPYTAVDNYAGAQKLLDMYLVPGATVSFRYYLKTTQHASFYKVRFAAGKYGELDYTIPDPATNRWVSVNVSYDDFVRENPVMVTRTAGHDVNTGHSINTGHEVNTGHNINSGYSVNTGHSGGIRVYALAFLAKIPQADPAMPIYLGLDDITFKGARATPFQFAEPAMYKLPEFAAYIPAHVYSTGDVFSLSGSWPTAVRSVRLELSSYTDTTRVLYRTTLIGKSGVWTLKPLKLTYPAGLYIGHLVAYGEGVARGEEVARSEGAVRGEGVGPIGSTAFTIHIVPRDLAGRHPRLLFDSTKEKWVEGRLKEARFTNIDDEIGKNAKAQREKISVDSLQFDLDQFPDENWLPTSAAWKSHFMSTGDGLWWNGLEYALHGDRAAGEYVKDVLLKLAGWPNWGHPWQIKRGRLSEHNTGTWSYKLAEAYDLTYDLMTPDERRTIRAALMKNIIANVHSTYVYNNNVTGNSSNWLAATVGGSLMNMAAIFGDGPETKDLEPYFTGALMKLYAFVTTVTDAKDGAWGEGLGYNTYSFYNLSQSVPALKNVFNIDISKPLAGTYNEYIWAGNLEKRQYFNFGDAHLGLVPFSNWAFLLGMQKDPRLGWLYHYFKQEETFQDVLYDTKDVAQQPPFGENPDKIFHALGTTVFKSGWKKDDFAFVMRTGAFYNHQHMDQGSFWLADHGVNFISEREGSAYYDDPLYQPWFIQPISHSTILIDGNHQSQRIGDELTFAPGFDDHAFIRQSLEGKNAAFSSGDIGRLYWGKVRSLSRNVLFLKPRTILLLDIATPGATDVDVTSLYQSSTLSGIAPGKQSSTITKEGFSLNIIHLAPERMEARAVETPHYYNTLLKERPLIREGMLTLTARTAGEPLVMANLLTSTIAGAAPDVTSTAKNGYVVGMASGKKFAFSTRPGSTYTVDGLTTDALALTWTNETIFVAMATTLSKNGTLLVGCDTPATFELDGSSLKYNCDKPCKITTGKAAGAISLSPK
jgi:hypothetical protein